MIRGALVDLRPLTAADIGRTERIANDPAHRHCGYGSEAQALLAR